ncbi:MAG TPA: CoA pyrophosphatase [Alcaligenaceae bacterium]|nr:CoA pyrophosphatase [Alcaligenaceae bacterium]
MSSPILLNDLARIEATRLGFDPQLQPLIEIPQLPGIDRSYLEPDFLLAAYSHPVQWGVEPLFANWFVPDFAQYPQGKQAAVCVPLVQRPSGIHVLLTRRAGHLFSHAGQVCFPGGRIEASDPDAVHAALRETHEEVGIEPTYIQTLGEQPIFITNSHYAMRPVVGLVKQGFSIRPDPSEVAEVFEVPLSVLMDPKNHRLHRLPGKDGNERYYFSMSWQDHFIWGATAAVIRNFYHHLAAASQQLGR